MGKETPYITAIRELFNRISTEIIGVDRPFEVNAYLAGGAAVHIYTKSRVSKGVDAVFSPPIHVGEVVVYYIDNSGRKNAVYLDQNYFPEIGLIHPDYQEDSKLLWHMDKLVLHILSPLDLAVTKLAHFAEIDQRDIENLAKQKLIKADELKRRAEEAMDYYVGRTNFLVLNIKDAVDMVRKLNG